MGRGPLVRAAIIAASMAASSAAIRAADPPAADAGWTDAGVRHGVSLSYRENPQLHARELRATAEVPVAAHPMFATVCDVLRYGEFVEGVVESSEVERSGPNDYVAYLRYAPKFLVIAARDVVLRVSLEEPPAGPLRCSWSQVAGRVPERPRAVRMPLFTGGWTVEPLGEGRSRITYHVTVKPGGSLPDWLVRWGASRALPDEVEAMQKRAAQVAARRQER